MLSTNMAPFFYISYTRRIGHLSGGRAKTLNAFDVKLCSKGHGALRDSVLLQGGPSDTINSQVKQLTITSPRRLCYGSKEQRYTERKGEKL